MLRFRHGTPLRQGRVGLLPGAFNPPTVAHETIAREARSQYSLDQVVFVLPEALPHKDYEGAAFEDRLAMLQALVAGEEGLAIASSEKGYFIDFAREAREACGPLVEIYLICGRDAAERIVEWDYGDGPPFAAQLEEFQLLVASRGRDYIVPADYAGRIHSVALPDSLDTVSSTNIRDAVAKGEPSRAWLNKRVADEIERRRLYR